MSPMLLRVKIQQILNTSSYATCSLFKAQKISNVRFSSTARHIYVKSNPSSNGATKVQGTIKLDRSVNDKATAVNVTWLVKATESDMSSLDCDDSPVLFKHMFPDSRIWEKSAVGRQKASYVIHDGLGPLVESKIAESVTIHQLYLP